MALGLGRGIYVDILEGGETESVEAARERYLCDLVEVLEGGGW